MLICVQILLYKARKNKLYVTITNFTYQKGLTTMNIIVTGGAGFIGSNFIFHMLKNTRITGSSVWTA